VQQGARDRASLKTGERQVFAVEAFDQDGQAFQSIQPEWSAAGGTIGADGV
jgi:hypothetical protein